MKFKTSTWLIIILLIGIVCCAFLLLNNKTENNWFPIIEQGGRHQTTGIAEEIVIDDMYVEGKYPVITGDSTIARMARTFIQDFADEMTTNANRDVPQIRADFPDSFQDVRYFFEVHAEQYHSEDTQSLVLSNHMYTGGANVNSFYTTFTQNNKGEIIELSALVPEEFQDTFVRAVQAQLINNVFFGSDAVYVFKDAVDELTFDQLTRFAVDGDDILIFFDEYEVSAGAAGLIKVYIENYEKLFQDHKQELFSLNTQVCFTSHEASDGTSTDEVLKLTRIDGQNVSGEKQGISQGAYNAGYFGTISGTLEGNTLEAIYSYTVDGSEQKQEERYVIRDGNLFAEIYQLTDDFENDMLIINREAKVRDKEYTMVDC